MIELKNIYKTFGGVKAIHNVSLIFEDNTIYALVGPNGCGKTSLLNIISGFYTPDQGDVYWISEFQKKCLTNMSPINRSQFGIGRVFQESRNFTDFTVEENLLISLMPIGSDNIFRSGLKKFSTDQCSQKIHNLLEWGGLIESRTKSAQNISYGQSKILGILSLLTRNVKVLLLDEPFEGVDPINLKILNKLIMCHAKKMSSIIIIVTHELEFVKDIADIMILMNYGTILESGHPQELMISKNFREVYLG